MKPIRSILFTLLISAVAGAEKDHWNQFRGPAGNGISAATNLPIEFDEAAGVRWKVAIPGVGWSSPVAWDNQVWVTTGRPDGRELFALCFDAKSGRKIHHIKVFDVENPGMEWTNQNPHSCPTPFIEEGRIYVHYGSYGTACLDTQSGKIIWKRQDLKCNHRVGPASSPIVFDDTVLLQFDGVDVQYAAALNKNTGSTQWIKKREVTTDLATRLRNQGLSEESVQSTLKKKPGDNRKSYATPTLIEFQGRRQLISPGAEVLYAYDPANGKELWRVEYSGWSWNVACRPLYAHGLIFATTGISKKLVAIRPNGSGDVTETHVAWTSERGTPNMSSPVAVGDQLIMVSDQGGIVTALNAETGKTVWRKRIGGNHWASPLFAAGKLYLADREGQVAVLDITGDKPAVLAENQMKASFIASPAVVDNALILRSTTHLYCLAKGHRRTAAQVAKDVYPSSTARAKPAARGVKAAKLAALKQRLATLVESGTLSQKEADELYESAQKAN